jgi:hypothetical protein
VADESTDTACNVIFATAATGATVASTGTNLTFDSNVGMLTATGFTGPLTGLASTATDVVTGGSIASNVTAATQASGTNDTTVATTAFVTAAADAAAAGLQVHTDVTIASGSHTVTCGLTNGSTAVTCSAAKINIGEVVTSAEDGLDSPPSGGFYVAAITGGNEGVDVTAFTLSSAAGAGSDSSEVLTFTMDLTPNWAYHVANKTLTHGDYVNTKLNGRTPVAGDRILLKNQAAALQNGVYVVSAIGDASSVALLLTRDANMDASEDFINAFVFVSGNNVSDVSVNDTSWVTTVDTDFAYASDAVTFGQFNGPGNMTAGTNMSKVGNSLNVDDAFLTNDASDSMSGTLTATGFTTGNSGIIKFMDGDGSHYTTIAAHGTTTTSEAYTLPAADGTTGQLLSTNGSGVMSWASAATGDVTDVIGGLGLDSDAATGDITLDLNLHELVAETIASGDFIPFVDSTDDGTHKESIDDIATLFAGSRLTALNGVISVDDDFVRNTNDTMTDPSAIGTTLIIDKNFSGSLNAPQVCGIHVDVDKTTATTTDSTIRGIQVNVDNTTPTSGTNTMIGLDLAATLTHAADAGTPTLKGAVISATGGTNGTSKATGMELTATGADTNTGLLINCADGGTDLKIVSSAAAADYATITVGASGATAITTVDTDAAIAHLTLTIDGSLIVAGASGIDIGAVSGGLSPVTNITLDGGTF